jgi:hypothetical protein
MEAAMRCARVIASQPARAIYGTVRSIWTARELGHRQAVNMAYALIGIGSDKESIAEGQKLFESGKRVEWRLR